MNGRENAWSLLTDMQEGEEGVIRRVIGGKNLLSRFASMGIATGAPLRILRNSGKGMIILQISGSRIALGRGEAINIFAQKITPPPATSHEPTPREIRVALAGQPNVGKSTVFNILTGLSQHIGNWHGKTVEKKEGTHSTRDAKITIVDLPGTYSLSAQSEEEHIAREHMMSDKVDIIVVIANAVALERGLYILSETLLLGKPTIFALNMFDLAQEEGLGIDCKALEEALGVPVIPMVATKNQGIRELVQRISAIAREGFLFSPAPPEIASNHREEFLHIKQVLQAHLTPGESALWTATKLLEGDTEVTTRVSGFLPPEVWLKIQSLLRQHEDALQAVLNGRYLWIQEMMRRGTSRFKMGQIALTDRIDKYLTRPLFGVPALIAFFSLAFFVAHTLGLFLQGIIESYFSDIAGMVTNALAHFPPWVTGLLVDGVIGGVGMVLSFLPVLAIFFAMLAVFENVGYMARAAFVMDRFMHIIGLHGKSFMPLCIGFGCNVPSMLGARILETQRERRLTIFLAPFIPCTPRLAVIALLASAILGKTAIWVFPSFLALSFLVLLAVGIVVKRGLGVDDNTHFIMELPVYQFPHLKTIMVDVWTRTLHFIQRAGTLILASAVFVWVFSYFPSGEIETSYLAMAGRALTVVGEPLGFDWRMLTAVLMSTAAKENAIAALGVLYSQGGAGLADILPTVMSKASALSFMAVIMLWIPCLATMAVMVRELGKFRFFIANLVAMAVIAYAVGVIVHQVALFFFQ